VGVLAAASPVNRRDGVRRVRDWRGGGRKGTGRAVTIFYHQFPVAGAPEDTLAPTIPPSSAARFFIPVVVISITEREVRRDETRRDADADDIFRNIIIVIIIIIIIIRAKPFSTGRFFPPPPEDYSSDDFTSSTTTGRLITSICYRKC